MVVLPSTIMTLSFGLLWNSGIIQCLSRAGHSAGTPDPAPAPPAANAERTQLLGAAGTQAPSKATPGCNPSFLLCVWRLGSAVCKQRHGRVCLGPGTKTAGTGTAALGEAASWSLLCTTAQEVLHLNLDVFMNRETDSALRGPEHAKCIQDVLTRPTETLHGENVLRRPRQTVSSRWRKVQYD